MKKIIDRREHKRFWVKDDIFVAFRPDFAKAGQIVEISMGGLGFRYIAGEYKSSGPVKLDIFSAGHGFYMKKLPFKTISDFDMVSNVPFTSVIMRRCGVQFEDLTHKQISQLEHFIANHTMGYQV